MKVHVSAILLLGLIGYASAEMDMGTWCMTYLSTYLEPVSNAHTSGGVPIASSLRPTFAVDSLTSAIRGILFIILLYINGTDIRRSRC